MPDPDVGGTNRLSEQRRAQDALKGVKSKAIVAKEKKEAGRVVAKKQKIKKRKTINTASKSLLPKEKTEKFEILVDGKEITDSYTGYPMKIYVPKGFDGGVDFYFPGGGTTIKKALGMDPLDKIWEKSCKNGSRRAIVIIEGKWDKKKEGWRKRYLRFGEFKALPSIVRTIQLYSESPVKNINAIGHSMGGQALHFLSKRAKVGTLSYLDATYWSAANIIDFARRGGRVNIAYRKGTKTAKKAREVINDKRLQMKEVVSGHWQSSNKKLNIYALSANKVGHGMVRSLFLEPFMGRESTSINVSALSMRRETVISQKSYPAKTLEPGKLHDIYITDAKNGVKNMPEKERAKYVKMLQKSSILEIRKNTKLLTEELKGKNDAQKAIDRTEECRRRIAAYSDKHEGGWSRVNYSQMDIDPNKPSHENGIGLGETYGLDPSNKKLAVKDRHTGEITIVTRSVVAKGKRHAGRMAYVDKNGDYFATYTGDWVRILSGHETDLENSKQLKAYMAELKEDTEIRSKYAKDNIDYGGEMKPVSTTVRVSAGPVPRHFPKTKKGEKLWKSIPEAKFLDDGKEINPREPFVFGRDSFGRKVVLRRSAMRAFYRARKIAESGKYQTPPGPEVRLKITSSYRSKADQRALNPSGKGGKYVAAPGKSWHQSGGAIDVIACVRNPDTGKWEGNSRHKNQIYLKKIMPRASFANLPYEMWHWEYGSTRWKRKTGRKGTRKYTKVMSVNRRRIGRFDRLI